MPIPDAVRALFPLVGYGNVINPLNHCETNCHTISLLTSVRVTPLTFKNPEAIYTSVGRTGVFSGSLCAWRDPTIDVAGKEISHVRTKTATHTAVRIIKATPIITANLTLLFMPRM